MAARTTLADGGPADPGDARRDAGRRLVPADLRRTRGAGGRVRPVAARPGAARPGPRGRRRRPAGHAVATVDLDAAGSASGTPTATYDLTGAGRSSARTVRARWWPGRPDVARTTRLPSRARADLPRARTTVRPRGCPDARDPRRLCRHRAGAGRAGQRRDRARTVVAVRRRRATAPGRSPTRSWRRRSRRPPTTRATGATAPPLDEVAGAWPLGGPGAAAGRAGLAAGRRRGGVPRPVHRRGAPPRARVGRARRPRPIRAHRCAAGTARSPPTSGRCAPVPGQGRGLVAGPGVPGAAGAVRVRRPAGRRRATAVRATMGLVMGDLVAGRSRARPALPRRAPGTVIGAQMHSSIAIDIAAPPDLVFGSPATSSAGPTCCPTTRARRLVERRADGALVVDFVARRPVRPGPRARPAGRLAVADLVRARGSGACGSSTSPGRPAAWT